LIPFCRYSFISGSSDNIKVWKCPDATFLRNISGHNAILNAMAINSDNVLVSVADNGTMKFWDYKSGYNFQSEEVKPQPGSLDSEAGIYDCCFDKTGSRLITCEADKTIKIWKEDENAVCFLFFFSCIVSSLFVTYHCFFADS
jgi:pleiotropic regulator 1